MANEKIYRKIDGGTWGDYKASHILATILNEPENFKHRGHISALICKFQTHLKALRPLKFSGHYTYFALKLYTSIRRAILDSELPLKIKTHAVNIIHAHYKDESNPSTIYYRLKVQLNDKGLTKNKLFDKAGGIIHNDNGNLIYIPFTDTNYFEPVYK